MKVLTVILLSLAVTGTHAVPTLRSPEQTQAKQPVRKGGRWYFADSGHAVYCLGPVRIMPQPDGNIQRVATFCQGERPMVPLRD